MSEFTASAEDFASLDFVKGQLADAEKARTALQKMIDALASLPALEHFLPSALRIVAEAIETTDCSYYEHRRGDPIRLKYWFIDGQVYGPEDIQSFGPEHPYADVKVLEAGFVMPDSYLGKPFRERTRAQVVDHRSDRPGDDWYEMRNRHQWYLSLNVPLVIDGEADGALVVNRGFDAAFSRSEVDLAERLGQQLALAMGVDRLAASAREVASAHARELVTKTEFQEMAKIDRALQKMTDTLAAMPDLANFIPAALRIVANSFSANDCAYYEHRRGDPIRLRYWFINDTVLSPEDIAALEGDHAFMSRLAVEGFTVPDDYLGVPFRQRVSAQVVDHSTAAPPSVFDMECRRRGWALELNVPLVVAGEADGALLIYRGLDAPFTEREIKLSERLAQQLALAIEANRLAENSKQAALSRERERAAESRASELAAANEVLRSTLSHLSQEHNLESFPRTILREAMRHTGATDGIIMRFDKYADALIPSIWLSCDDAPAPTDLARPIPISLTSTWNTLVERREPMVFDVLALAPEMPGPLAQWHQGRGNRSVIAVALFVGPQPYGYFGITLRDRAQEVSNVQVDLIRSMAQQATLAIQLMHLAETSKQAAITVERQQIVAQERGNMAREIHDRLAQGYAAILIQQHTLRRLLVRDVQPLQEISPLIEQLDVIERLSRENLAEARRAMDELRNDPFDFGDLADALRRCIHKFSNAPEFVATLRIDGQLPLLRRYVETELCRIVTEAVTNAQKHARTIEVNVSVAVREGALLITIRDEGVGFDAERIGPSFGLSGMRERAARAGARLLIRSRPGFGTEVQILLAI